MCGGGRQDAHEFLGDLLDYLEEELRPFCRVAQPPAAPSALAPPPAAAAGLKPLCPVLLNFRCVIEHRITCNECGGVSLNRELWHAGGATWPPSAWGWGGWRGCPSLVLRSH